jgi:hypothetical protein
MLRVVSNEVILINVPVKWNFDTHNQGCHRIVNFVTNSNTTRKQCPVEFWGRIDYIDYLKKK